MCFHLDRIIINIIMLDINILDHNIICRRLVWSHDRAKLASHRHNVLQMRRHIGLTAINISKVVNTQHQPLQRNTLACCNARSHGFAHQLRRHFGDSLSRIDTVFVTEGLKMVYCEYLSVSVMSALKADTKCLVTYVQSVDR